MASDSSVYQQQLNQAIRDSLKANPDINGLVYVTYDNKDLGIQEKDMPVHA
jgi:hypothetical protein